jgi:hypothetical protein
LNQLRRNFIRQTYAEIEGDNGTPGLFEVLKKINEHHKIIVDVFERKDKSEIERFIRDVHWNLENAKFDSY